MPQMNICKTRHGRYFADSWTTGPAIKKEWTIKTDSDAIAYAMYLTRLGRDAEAERFLDNYC